MPKIFELNRKTPQREWTIEGEPKRQTVQEAVKRPRGFGRRPRLDTPPAPTRALVLPTRLLEQGEAPPAVGARPAGVCVGSFGSIEDRRAPSRTEESNRRDPPRPEVASDARCRH